MTRLLYLILLLSCTILVEAQITTKGDDTSGEYNLDFETAVKGKPDRWTNYSQLKGYRIAIDSVERHSGKYSLLIEKVDALDPTTIAQSHTNIPARYEGREIEISAYIKTESVSGSATLSVALDDEDYDRIQFKSIGDKVNGTRGWKKYSIKIPLPKNARWIRLWPTLIGSGKFWIDNINILIDGKDINLAAIKSDFNPVPKKFVPYGNNSSAGKFIKVNDADIYYETYGTGEPLLLLHGSNQSLVAFKKQIIEFSKYYKVIAVDSRGQGKSDDRSSTALTYDLFAEDMKALLDSLKISNTRILGWSDGGNTGLIMAFKYPSYVNKLAVMGANVFPTEEAVPSSILKEVRKIIAGLKLKSDDKSKIQLKLYTMLLNEPHMTVGDLKNIKSPVLVMAGEKDIILEKHTKYIAANIPSSKLVIFKGATHYAPIEIVSEFNAEVIKFLGSKN